MTEQPIGLDNMQLHLRDSADAPWVLRVDGTCDTVLPMLEAYITIGHPQSCIQVTEGGYINDCSLADYMKLHREFMPHDHWAKVDLSIYDGWRK